MYTCWCAQTLLYVVKVLLSEKMLSVKFLVRGPWNEKSSHIDVQKKPDCYSMCKLFRNNGIPGIRSRASYLGCYLNESKNSEKISPQMEVDMLDCERWSARLVRDSVPSPSHM